MRVTAGCEGSFQKTQKEKDRYSCWREIQGKNSFRVKARHFLVDLGGRRQVGDEVEVGRQIRFS